MEEKEKWYFSVWFIVISMICFWPIGVVLLILKIIGKNKRYKGITNFIFITGILLLGFYIVFIPSCIGEPEFRDIFVGGTAMFLLPGLVLFILGLTRRKKLKVYEKYLDCINFKNKIAIATLCTQIGTTSDVVIKNLREMISKGLINAYINESDYLIINNSSSDFSYSQYRYEPKEEEVVVVKCKACGATNKIVVGKPQECEYCGTMLNVLK